MTSYRLNNSNIMMQLVVIDLDDGLLLLHS